MMKKYEAGITLDMNITRRCNMKCDYCFKGDAENQTITKEIIDKTLDELQNFALISIRLFGGEPFLHPEMVVYALDQIIERNLTLGHVQINTNGTITNPEIRDALEKITRYIENNKSVLRKVFPMLDYSREPFVVVSVSTIRHENSNDEVEKCIAYYNKIDVPGFECRRDTSNEKMKPYYVLKGNALKNYRKILKNPVNINYLDIPSYEYDFITPFNYSGYSQCDLPYDIILAETIGVSTNGDVYAGCAVSWNEVSEKKMFNIADCSSDFLRQIDDYCWKHPVNKKIANLRGKCALLDWCFDNGYLVENVDVDTYNTLLKMVGFSNLHEEAAKAVHKELPFLNHEEVDRACSAQAVIEMLCQGYGVDIVKRYMNFCTVFTQDMIDSCDMANMINLRETIIKEAEEREGLREKSSKTSAVSQTTPEKLGSALGLMLGLALFAGKKK